MWLAAALGLTVLLALAGWLLVPARSPAASPAPTALAHPGSSGSAPASGTGAADPSPAGGAVTGAVAGVDPTRLAVARGQWSKLPVSVQVVLKPLEEDWSELTPDQRLKWFDLGRRFGQLPPDEQRRVQERMVDWARMTPSERGLARLNFQEIRQVSLKERLERWEAYQGLEVGERRLWAERAQATFGAPASPRRPETGGAPTPKSSGAAAEQVANATSPARPVSGTVVQAPWGATTVLVSRLPTSTAAGSGPKIAATPEFVDPVTLLPAAARANAAASTAPSSPGSQPGAPNPSGGAEPAPAEPAGPSSGQGESGSAGGEPVTRPQP